MSIFSDFFWLTVIVIILLGSIPVPFVPVLVVGVVGPVFYDG